MTASRQELRAKMIDLISAYSEDRWAAGWMNGIEEDVRKEGGVWLTMAAACGGWPKGCEAKNGWEPLSDEEWQEFGRLTRGEGGARKVGPMTTDDTACSCLECAYDDHMHCHHGRCCFCDCTHKPKRGEHGFEPLAGGDDVTTERTES